MTRDAVMAGRKNAGALLEGHFLLTSGLYGPVYLQSARVLMDPTRTERLCRTLADQPAIKPGSRRAPSAAR